MAVEIASRWSRRARGAPRCARSRSTADPDTRRLVGRRSACRYHAYSASGNVTAPVIYAGNGAPADYDWLAANGIDIHGKIVLVRYSVPYSYRGFKAFTRANGAAPPAS